MEIDALLEGSWFIIGAVQLVKDLWDKPLKENLRTMSLASVAALAGALYVGHFFGFTVDYVIYGATFGLTSSGIVSVTKESLAKLQPKK
jgi:hypothetical protein